MATSGPKLRRRVRKAPSNGPPVVPGPGRSRYGPHNTNREPTITGEVVDFE